MISQIENSKILFSKNLIKGKLTTVQEVLDSIAPEKEYIPFIKRWYENITKAKFLPDFPSDLEEIFIHNPTHIVYKTRGSRFDFDSDLTNEDLDILIDYLVLKNQIQWNTQDPFCSFFTTLRGRDVRVTILNGSTNSDRKNKIFIRFLNVNVFPLTQYSKNEVFWNQLINSKKNILVAGATGSGKTTFINTLIDLIPKEEHLTIIEDTKELIAKTPNVTRFLTNKNSENHSLLSYLKYSLRISPDRIILGELRSSEVEAFLLALNSGHNGVLSTIHANNAQNALEKFALLFQLYAKNPLSYGLALKLVCTNIDYVVFLKDKKIDQLIQVFGSEDNQTFFETIT